MVVWRLIAFQFTMDGLYFSLYMYPRVILSLSSEYLRINSFSSSYIFFLNLIEYSLANFTDMEFNRKTEENRNKMISVYKLVCVIII